MSEKTSFATPPSSDRHNLEVSLSVVVQERDELKEWLRLQQEQHEELMKSLNVITQERDELNHWLGLVKQERNELLEKLSNFDARVSQSEGAAAKLQQDYERQKLDSEDLKNSVATLLQERDELKKRLRLQQDWHEELTKLLNVIGQERDELNHWLGLVKQERDELLEKLSNFDAGTTESKEVVDALRQDYERLKLDSENLTNSIITVIHERDELRRWLDIFSERISAYEQRYERPHPFGHFYSPVPDLDEVRENAERIFRVPRSLPAIDLNEDQQWAVFKELAKYYPEIPFTPHKSDGLRYFFENPAYGYSDAICLYGMLRYARPKQVIEVGSGYSSCVTLDTNELFFDNSISCTFIEPYPELLHSLIKEDDKQRVEIIPSKVQDVPLEKFDSLGANDILFIDSSHVSKVGSDVNHIFFEILPRLASGVFIHFHDIHYPFEYKEEWVYEGRVWSETYLLRAFLQYNDAFKIVFFNTYLEYFHERRFAEAMPLCLLDRGGSIWLRKL